MTTQTSPFEIDNNNSSSAPSVSSDEFSIHTMKDDLELMKKGEFVLSEKATTPVQKPTPALSSNPIAPQPKTETVPAPVDYSKNPSPFFAAQPAPQKEMASKSLPASAPYKLEDPFVETNKVETFSPKQPLQNPSAPTSSPSTTAPQSNPFEKKDVPIVEIPTMESSAGATNGTAYKMIIIVIFVLIVAILGLGGYYFWMTKTPSVIVEEIPTEETVNEEVPVAEETPIVIAQPSEKYSTSKPNYLVLDVASMGAEEIKNVLISTASEIKELSPSSIYEFLIVDKNNNPVTFAIFAAATKLNLSQNVLSALEKDFSLFLYNDNGNSRLGISVSIKNKDLLAKQLLVQEKTFATDVAPIFLDVKPQIQAGWVFKDGSYGAYKTRYLNLDATGSLSIDYTVAENKLVIGTSMQTMRAALEKSKTTTTVQEPAILESESSQSQNKVDSLPKSGN